MRNILLITLLLILSLFHLQGQTPPGDCPCDPDDPEYDICAELHPECDFTGSIPIDKELEWLLAGGVLLGLIVIRSKKRVPIHE